MSELQERREMLKVALISQLNTMKLRLIASSVFSKQEKKDAQDMEQAMDEGAELIIAAIDATISKIQEVKP